MFFFRNRACQETYSPMKVKMGNPQFEYCEYEGGNGGKMLNGNEDGNGLPTHH